LTVCQSHLAQVFLEPVPYPIVNTYNKETYNSVFERLKISSINCQRTCRNL